MASSSNRRGDNTSYALSTVDKTLLTETRRFTQNCENKIKEDKANFSAKSSLGLWWDAKGLFSCSNMAEVTAHMERYKKVYEEIDACSALVEKNDPESYDKLYDLYQILEEMERDAQRDVENNQSTAICQMLREFLDKKYKLDHNLKKVECIVMKQKMKTAEEACKTSKEEVVLMSRKMDELIDENRAVRRESDERLKRVMEEAEEKSEARILEMRKQTEQLRQEKEEAERRSETVRLESEERLKRVLQESEERSEARLREIKEEAERYRLEAERIRRESDEKLQQAVEEANRRSEARMREMAEQNRANLQKMTQMLERMNFS